MCGMEFFSTRFVSKAQKPHTCELCGRAIKEGEPYYQEIGKFYGDFFFRCLHPICHEMEEEYCNDVDNEFTWDAIVDYVVEKRCDKCEHSCRYDDRDDWIECSYSHVQDCDKIINAYAKRRL